MKKTSNELLCISCGVSHLMTLNDIIVAYNNGSFNVTVVFEWKCEQCKTINHFSCYGQYVKVD